MSPLDRKLLRDLVRMKLQSFAIALVIAVGVLLLVMMNGLVNSLEQTRQAYYDRYRIADVFAPVKRAPDPILDRISEIAGVAAVEGRVAAGALIDIEGQTVPIRARAISLPEFREPRLNAIYLAEGRQIDPRRTDEIILLQGFAKAHGLGPGDRLSATMNSARHTFRIVGLAEAPEFLYSTAPGEIVPDDSRFAVIWMNEEALAAAFDLDGAFNEALVSLERGASLPAVINAVDHILDRYGGTGAYGLEDQFSNRFIVEEISSLRVSSRSVPPIFMGVAAFLLYIVISRMIEAERTQIGLLKAFGYSSTEIGWHYLKFILVISAGGALLGCGLGVLSGQALSNVYQDYYKFPFLLFRVDPAAFITAIAVSVTTASAGGLLVLKRIFSLAPAEAMRPPAPADFAGSARLVDALKVFLDQPSRMIVRRIARQPFRTFAATIGIAVGMGLSVAMLSVLGGFNKAIDMNFNVIDRSDASVSFVEPLGEKAIYELKQVDGIIDVEPFRDVAVVFRNGVKSHRGALSGLIEDAELNRAMSDDVRQIHARKDGIVMSEPLARKLGLKAGLPVIVEFREGRRPVRALPVTRVSQSLLGAPSYFELSALNEALEEPGRVTGARLRIDASREDEVYETLKNMPAVAGVSLKGEAREALQRMMDEGAGATRYYMAIIAGIITFGIVYNSARIAYAERAHDLASLRVLGFTKGQAAYVLLGELGIITLFALPIGALIGAGLAGAIAAGFSTDLYSVPARVGPVSIGSGALAVLAAAVFAGWLVKRDVDRLELVSALKTRE